MQNAIDGARRKLQEVLVVALLTVHLSRGGMQATGFEKLVSFDWIALK